MRLSKILIVVPVLALLAMGCAPRRQGAGPHHGPAPGMMHGCGPDSCGYQSQCFSNGAVRSNDGVCQACNGGRWVEASGCAEHHHDGCCGHSGCPGPKDCPHMKGKKSGAGGPPCGREGGPGGPPPCHKR
ncbi:MAG: hypothetical protein IT294_16830 [Deltaproteobacteria bacterium]|nr:hypothetical protein [Deltaproteobacteria bacterium]